MQTFSTMILTSLALCVTTTAGLNVTFKTTLCCMTKEQCEESGEALSSNLDKADDLPTVTCEESPENVCVNAECGKECMYDGNYGVCSGSGSCVPLDHNPCAHHGCGGLSCGDECLLGDIGGICNGELECVLNGPPIMDCGPKTSAPTSEPTREPSEEPTEYPTREPTAAPTSVLRQQQPYDDYEAWTGDCAPQDPDLWWMDSIFYTYYVSQDACRDRCNADASCTGFEYTYSQICTGYKDVIEGIKSEFHEMYRHTTTCYVKRSATPAPTAGSNPSPGQSTTITPAPTASVSNRRRSEEDKTWEVTYVFSTESQTDAEELQSEIVAKQDWFPEWWSTFLGVTLNLYEPDSVKISGVPTGFQHDPIPVTSLGDCPPIADFPELSWAEINTQCYLGGCEFHDGPDCKLQDEPNVWRSCEPVCHPKGSPPTSNGTFAIDESGALTFEGGYVCDDSFDENAGKMICGLLGEDFTSWLPMLVESDDFTLDGLACPDGATTLDDCYYNTESEDCFAHEGVRLTCGGDGYGGDESTISAGEIVLLIFLLLLGCCCTSCIIYCVCFGGLAAGILCCKKTNDNVGEEGDNHV